MHWGVNDTSMKLIFKIFSYPPIVNRISPIVQRFAQVFLEIKTLHIRFNMVWNKITYLPQWEQPKIQLFEQRHTPWANDKNAKHELELSHSHHHFPKYDRSLRVGEIWTSVRMRTSQEEDVNPTCLDLSSQKNLHPDHSDMVCWVWISIWKLCIRD